LSGAEAAIPKVGIDHRTLAERVFQELRHAIVYGTLSPGTRLQSEELAQRLGVSRTPVKEALSRLRVEGLVEYNERRGFSVVDYSPEDLPEIHEALLMMEMAGIELGLAEASETEIEGIRAAADHFTQSCNETSPDAQVAYDQGNVFHYSLVKLNRNGIIEDWYSQLKAESQGLRLQAIHKEQAPEYFPLVDEHRPIVDAIEQRDANAAQTALQSHWRHVNELLLKSSAFHSE
jgi:GntR family transcriptional regulator, rspAB operon transcriptional repressor